MKRFTTIIITFIVLYAIYNDLSRGTLPSVTSVKTTSVQAESSSYFKKKVVPGDTVLSIMENHYDASMTVPISEVVSDFEKLNNGISPQEIVAGQTYKFPAYPQKN